MEIFEIRRFNLIYLIEKNFIGQTKKFAEAVGKQANYISRLKTGTSSGKTFNGRIGTRSAREFEKRLNLESGCFDKKLWANDQEFKQKYLIDIHAEPTELSLKIHPLIGNLSLNSFTRIDLTETAALKFFGKTNLNSFSLYPVLDDSMEPTIPVSALAIIDLSINNMVGNGIYLFQFADVIYFKRLAIGKAGIIHVISDNQLYLTSNFEINKNEFHKFNIIGKLQKTLIFNVIKYA